MPELDAEEKEGENDWNEEEDEDQDGFDAEGETWRVEFVGDAEDMKVKKVRFAAGTKGRSDRKEWMKKLRTESWERAEAGDAAGYKGCGITSQKSWGPRSEERKENFGMQPKPRRLRAVRDLWDQGEARCASGNVGLYRRELWEYYLDRRTQFYT